MTIIRAPRPDHGFSIISNETARDMRLSRRARGLLIEMLTHTDGWRTDAASLAAAGTEGRDAIRTALRELEDFHYLARVKSHDAAGRWTTATYLFDRPATDADLAALVAGPPPDPDEISEDEPDDDEEYPREDASSQVRPGTGKPSPVNQGLETRRLETRTSVPQALKALEDHEQNQSLSPEQRLTAQLLGIPDGDERLGMVHQMLADNSAKNPRAWIRTCAMNGDLEELLDATYNAHMGAHYRALSVDAQRCTHGKINGHITCPDCTDALVST